VYKKQLMQLAGTEAMPRRTQQEFNTLFANIDAIIPVNQHMLRAIADRVRNWSEVQLIGAVFLKMVCIFATDVKMIVVPKHATY
jgi:hypothetical protein